MSVCSMGAMCLVRQAVQQSEVAAHECPNQAAPMLPLTGPQRPWLPGLMYTYKGWLPLVAQVWGKGPAGSEEVGGGRWNELQTTASAQHLLPNGRRRVSTRTLTVRQRRPQGQHSRSAGHPSDKEWTACLGSLIHKCCAVASLCSPDRLLLFSHTIAPELGCHSCSATRGLSARRKRVAQNARR